MKVICVGMILAVCAAVALWVGLRGNSSADSGIRLEALVLRCSGSGILVAPAEDAGESRSADRIWVSAAPEDVRVGDMVEITYDGMIAESYPAQIHNVYSVQILNSILTDDICMEVSDGLDTEEVTYVDCWAADGYAVLAYICGEGYGIVYIYNGELYRVSAWEDMVPITSGTGIWCDRSMTLAGGKLFGLELDPVVEAVNLVVFTDPTMVENALENRGE